MAARQLRYRWFDTLSEQNDYDLILVAHHADDALETFMINAMRGTGLKGLLGIPERRGKILRPMLSFSREEIMLYALENKIQWREDLSNAKTDYLRNALRHQVIPQWKKRILILISSFKKHSNIWARLKTFWRMLLVILKRTILSHKNKGLKFQSMF